jgi:hypothetical protein
VKVVICAGNSKFCALYLDTGNLAWDYKTLNEEPQTLSGPSRSIGDFCPGDSSSGTGNALQLSLQVKLQ